VTMLEPEEDMASTRVLLGHAADGDDQAREALCKRYRRPLLLLARGRLPASSRGMMETEDLVHDVIIRSVQRAPELRDIDSGGFLFYMRRGVLNALANEYRKSRVQPRQVELDTQQPNDEPSPLDEFIKKEELDLYEEALQALRPADQDLIIARIELKQSYRQIAIELGRPSEDAARMAVKRAIARLAEKMRDR
jgi:RNA polymerase sigma-70 factor, ECF subfamily